MKSELIEEKTTGGIIGAFYEVYNRLGFGFLEHAYALAMERELLARGHTVRREVTVFIHYKGEPLTTHRLDMLVDEKVVVEIKSTAQLPTFSKRQTLNCLRATAERGNAPPLRPRSQILSARPVPAASN